MQWKHLAILSTCFLISCSSLDAGWRAHRSGDYDEAQRQTIAALAKEPRNPSVYQLAAATALARGQYDSAVKAAEFACSLDGGSAQSEAYVRAALAAKKDWKSLCEAGLRAYRSGIEFDDNDRSMFAEGWKSLANASDGAGYGCVMGLSAAGPIEGAETAKMRYAAHKAMRGEYTESLEVSRSCAVLTDCSLSAAQSLFALGRKDEAAAELNAYVGAAQAEEREARIKAAAGLCDEYRQWGIGADLLSRSESPDNEIAYAIALRRMFKESESDEILARHFARNGRDTRLVLDEMKALCGAGYGALAVQSWNSCVGCADDGSAAFKAADFLADAGELSAASEILSAFGDKQAEDGALQVSLFAWFRKHKLNGSALTCAERAVKLGAGDDAFHAERLQTYIDMREIKVFQREAEAWIASAPVPAADRRLAVAQIEANRSNWAGVASVLSVLRDNGELSGSAVNLEIKALRSLRDFPALYEVMAKYAPDMAPLKRADSFFDVEAEKQYRDSIAPMLSGTAYERFEGEMAIAKFLYVARQDKKEGMASLERALEHSGKSGDGYVRIVNFLNTYGDRNDALTYAQKWSDTGDAAADMRMAEIYLIDRNIEEASSALNRFVSRSSDKKGALTAAYSTFGRMNQSDEGLEWLKTISAGHAFEDPFAAVLADAYYEHYQVSRDGTAERLEYQRRAAEGYTHVSALAASNADTKLMCAGRLYLLGAYDSSARAYDDADKSGAKWTASQQRMRVQAYIRAGRSENEIKEIVKSAEKPEDVFAMTDVLNDAQRPDYARPVLEKVLSDKSIKNQTRAFSYLVDNALSSGQPKRIAKYAETLEKAHSDSADIRLILAQNAMMQNDWDEAVRHLTYLQAMRPDARDVLNAQLTLARRAPSHAGAQTLVSNTIASAEGVYHRLDWISQYFEQYGDYRRALAFARKAADAASVKDFRFELRLLGLYLRANQFDSDAHSETGQILASLRSSSQWKPASMLGLAQIAQSSGYNDAAQVWMSEAVAMNPTDTAMRTQKLEMALDANHKDQVAFSVSKAIENPVAEVVSPLKKSGYMLDIIDVIDMFAENGEYEMAVSALIGNLPAYLQVRGVARTRRALDEMSALAADYRSEAVSILAENTLLGSDPCQALVYLSELDSPRDWARIAVSCPDARDGVMSAAMIRRNKMPLRTRAAFDNAIYDSFVDMQQPQLASDYAERSGMHSASHDTGLNNEAWTVFERSLASGDPLAAMIALTQNSISADRHIEVLRLIAAYGYFAEASDYARSHIHEMNRNDRVSAAAIAVIGGAEDEIFRTELESAGKADEQNLRMASVDPASASRIFAKNALWKYMNDVSNEHFNSALSVASAAAAHDSQMQIQSMIDEEIRRRPYQVSAHINASRHASAHGMFAFAEAQLEAARDIQPASDSIWLMLSQAQAHNHKIDEAAESLRQGALCTAQLESYWKKALEMHADADIRIRTVINRAQLEQMPGDPHALARQADIALAENRLDDAKQAASQAWKNGKNAVIGELIDIYASHGRSPDFADDEDIIALTEAALAMQNGKDAASLVRSARRTPWPVETFGMMIDSKLEQADFPAAEQIIASMAQDYPHAYMPHVYRAVYEIMHGNTDNAWAHYLQARSLSVDTNVWIGKLAAAAALNNHSAFLHKLYDYELSTGSFNPSAWIAALTDAFLNTKNADKLKITEQEYAKRGMQLIEALLPQTGYTVSSQDVLRERVLRLAAKAERIDWCSRISASNL